MRAALESIWKYDWAPDIGPQNEAHPPQRWFARPGEAGLFTCTWPKSKHLGRRAVLYRDEVWTGIEYQVAGHMVWEGMVTEALAICRGVHERYHPAKHNPWNEIECGDHYARGMASYGVFLALCGFEYHGPKGTWASPRGWRPTISAPPSPRPRAGVRWCRSEPASETNRVEVKWGKLRLADARVRAARRGQSRPSRRRHAWRARPVEVETKQDGRRVMRRAGRTDRGRQEVETRSRLR